MENLTLHAVIVKKIIPFADAKRIAAEIINNPRRKFFRETKQSWRFRNVAKSKFKKSTFRTKIINPNLSLVFGILKNG